MKRDRKTENLKKQAWPKTEPEPLRQTVAISPESLALLSDPDALKWDLRDDEVAGAPGGWCKVPTKRAIFAPWLTPSARLVLMALYSYDWLISGHRKGYAEPSLHSLARYLGLSKRTVQKALGELQKEGYLTVITGGGRHQCNRYYFTPLAQEGRE